MRTRGARGFTLLEVMVAIAVLGIAMLGLLSLHHQSLQSVMRAQDTTQAAMLAQAVMTNAELTRFPDLGTSRGDFHEMFKDNADLYRNFRWEQRVDASGSFPDVRKVRVIIYYGPHLNRSFALTELIHSPLEEREEGGFL